MKKILILGFLFLFPITAYLFFSSGVNNFAKLPVLTENISEISEFESIDGEKITLEGKITALGFFGSDLQSKYGNVFNLTHKIYIPFHEFDDLQFVTVLQRGNENLVKELLVELDKITDTRKWKFVYGSPEEITILFNSLKTNILLDENFGTSQVFIIDKDKNLRGRSEDEDGEVLYGFDTSSIAELNNKMKDDIKVLLAEYRLALKKYNTKREI
ncbi:MAG: hypothetical protein AUK33_09770 [Flavobacteriaceae bacterium CG2_30_34_30]|nr:MAG: hypothetical protein AUK33_09770 [Flavobacteriaceae bacterium CG2_30_34_30]PIV48540.1 MAG: hypothetical protein COS19_13375 [Flavobacteriaceae bacterium CG02_land_8_20_14_3_00_34_13]